MSEEEKLKDHIIALNDIITDFVHLLNDITKDKELSNSIRNKMLEAIPKIYKKQSKLIEHSERIVWK